MPPRLAVELMGLAAFPYSFVESLQPRRWTRSRDPVLGRTCPVPLSCPDKDRARQVQGTGQAPLPIAEQGATHMALR